jgi:hypothetical protein
MARPVIALLTDFGSRDHYAGVMKGVILGICPDVTLVDISHDLPPHDILFAAHEPSLKKASAGTPFWSLSIPAGTTRRGWRSRPGTSVLSRRTTGPDSRAQERHRNESNSWSGAMRDRQSAGILKAAIDRPAAAWIAKARILLFRLIRD